jgi:PAS domain S-box-containing protein
MISANRPLRVLLVEDSENDAALLELELERAGYHCVSQRVETAEAMNDALDRSEWDAVIADYVMPRFNGLSALALLKEKNLDLPFIIVSGHISDDTAVAAMKAGAHDYVMKDKLARLGPAVTRELREAEVRLARRQSEEKLLQEHAFRQAIENSVPSGISVVDLEGRQTYVNPAFCAMVGWSESELIGAKPPFAYWPHEEVETITGALATVIQGKAPPEGLELRFQRRDGERFDVLILVTPLRDVFGNVTGWLNSITDITRRKEAEAALRRSHEELEIRVRQRTADLTKANAQLQALMDERRRLEHELLEITERERRRIGLDLHDDLGQKLSGIALMIKGLELKLRKERSTGAKEAGKIHHLVEEAMSHASDVAHDLATLDMGSAGLAAALNGLALHARETYRVTCQFKAEGSVPQLESNIVHQLYKIAQEALTNAIKHGKAKRVGISLANGSNRLVLTIRNTGKAFPAMIGRHTGMGLRIMNYRANLIGASLEVKPGRSEGTVVTCRLGTSERSAVGALPMPAAAAR